MKLWKNWLFDIITLTGFSIMSYGLWQWDQTGCLIISGGILFFGPILITLKGTR